MLHQGSVASIMKHARRASHQPSPKGDQLNPRDLRFLPKCACGRPAPVGKRKCARCISTNRMKVTEGRPVRKGSNARGVAAHKPDRSRTRKAKRQNVPSGGPKEVVAYKMKPSRADRKPNEEIW